MWDDNKMRDKVADEPQVCSHQITQGIGLLVTAGITNVTQAHTLNID